MVWRIRSARASRGILYLSQTPICCYLHAPARVNFGILEMRLAAAVWNISLTPHTATSDGPILVPSKKPSLSAKRGWFCTGTS